MPTNYQFIEIPDVAKFGWVPSLPPERIVPGAWTVARNVRFVDGRVENVRGWKTHKDSEGVAITVGGGEPGLICRNRFMSGLDVSTVCTAQRIYRLNGSGTVGAGTATVQLNAEDFTTGDHVRWEAINWPAKTIFNRDDGLLRIQRYDGATLIDLPAYSTAWVSGRAPHGKSISSFKSHLIVGAVVNDGQGNTALESIAASDLADGIDPQGEDDWDYLNDASEAVLQAISETNGRIQRLVRLGDYLAAYTDSEIVLINYLGASALIPYSTQVTPASNGVLAPGSIVRARGQHFFVGLDNLYVFNGSAPTPIGAPVYRDFLAKVMPADPRDLWCFDDALRQELIWGGNRTQALVYNYDNGVWSLRDWPFACAAYVNLDQESFTLDTIPAASLDEWGGTLGDIGTLYSQRILAADYAGNLFVLAEIATAEIDGVPMTSRLESGVLTLGLRDRRKICNGLAIDGTQDGVNPLQVYVSAREYLGEDIEWRGPYAVTNGLAFFHASGRYFNFALEKLGGKFSLTGIAPSFQAKGRW